MIKKGCLIFTTIALAVFLTGCLEQSATDADNDSQNVILESNIVELAYAKLNPVKENNVVKRVEVEYRLKNIVDRRLYLNVYVQFYDDEGNLITTSGVKNINLPPNYEESLSNIVSYDGEFTSQVDYARLLIEERTWIIF